MTGYPAIPVIHLYSKKLAVRDSVTIPPSIRWIELRGVYRIIFVYSFCSPAFGKHSIEVKCILICSWKFGV